MYRPMNLNFIDPGVLTKISVSHPIYYNDTTGLYLYECSGIWYISSYIGKPLRVYVEGFDPDTENSSQATVYYPTLDLINNDLIYAPAYKYWSSWCPYGGGTGTVYSYLVKIGSEWQIGFSMDVLFYPFFKSRRKNKYISNSLIGIYSNSYLSKTIVVENWTIKGWKSSNKLGGYTVSFDETGEKFVGWRRLSDGVGEYFDEQNETIDGEFYFKHTVLNLFCFYNTIESKWYISVEAGTLDSNVGYWEGGIDFLGAYNLIYTGGGTPPVPAIYTLTLNSYQDFNYKDLQRTGNIQQWLS